MMLHVGGGGGVPVTMSAAAADGAARVVAVQAAQPSMGAHIEYAPPPVFMSHKPIVRFAPTPAQIAAVPVQQQQHMQMQMHLHMQQQHRYLVEQERVRLQCGGGGGGGSGNGNMAFPMRTAESSGPVLVPAERPEATSGRQRA